MHLLGVDRTKTIIFQGTVVTIVQHFWQDLVPDTQCYQSWIRQKKEVECVCIVYIEVISETGWVVDWGGTVVRYTLPTLLCADEWPPHSARNWIIWRAFSSMSAFGNAICSHCPLRRWAKQAKCRGTEHTSLSEVTDDFDSIVPLETGTPSHDSRVSDIEWHVYFLKHWHVSLPH